MLLLVVMLAQAPAPVELQPGMVITRSVRVVTSCASSIYKWMVGWSCGSTSCAAQNEALDPQGLTSLLHDLVSDR
jgi:hypothetical protein